MKLSDVVGNEAVKRELKKQIQTGKIPHAQIFLGMEGSGTLPMAMAFAQALQCESPVESDACGTCDSCKRAGKMIHADIEYSFPYFGNKFTSNNFLPGWREINLSDPYFVLSDWTSKNGWSTNNPNIYSIEIENIVNRINQRKFEGRHKIMVLWLPEYLGKDGNRLLKFIEEPPPDTLIVMVAQSADNILSTLLSRCRIIPFAPLENGLISRYLINKYGVGEREADIYAAMSEGNIGEAVRLHREGLDKIPDLFVSFIRAAYSGSGNMIYDWSEEFAKLDKSEHRQFFIFGLQFFKLMLRMKFIDGVGLSFNADLDKAARYLLKNIKFTLFKEVTDFFDKGIYYLERNVNIRILGTVAVVRVHKIFKKQQYENSSVLEGQFLNK